MGALLGRKAVDAAIEKAEERQERQPPRPITLPVLKFLTRPYPSWWNEPTPRRQREEKMGSPTYSASTERRIKEMAASGSSLDAIAAEIGKTRDATRVWLRRHAISLQARPPVTTAGEAAL